MFKMYTAEPLYVDAIWYLINAPHVIRAPQQLCGNNKSAISTNNLEAFLNRVVDTDSLKDQFLVS